MLWHVLDTGSIWLKEFAHELGGMVPSQNWVPKMRNLGHWERWEETVQVPDPALQMIQFPVQRAYSRWPVAQILPYEAGVLKRLRRHSDSPENTGLICTAPFYAPVAEGWPGPVVYYLTDLTKKYAGMNEQQVVALDRRMCQVAKTVCPNSRRIADYLCQEAGCPPQKITVIPNATRQQNILDQPLLSPASLPADCADLPRPVVGVIGNLAGNMDWQLISDAVTKIPDVSWLFVGPTSMGIEHRIQREARNRVAGLGGRVRFAGSKPYGQLASYARSFDMALLPYLKNEPTYSGSATRFYEHLAACRPIVATRGFHELLSKEPLLQLIDTADELATAVEQLQPRNFRDGLEEQRWHASREGTWRVRARDLLQSAGITVKLKVA